MTLYDPDTLKSFLDYVVSPAGSTTAQGRRLQLLVAFLVGHCAGAEVADQNLFNAAHSEEVDVWLRHKPHLSGMPFKDSLVPVECKNEQTPTSAPEVTVFSEKIGSSGGFDGIIVTRTGLSGSVHTSAHDEIKKALAKGRVIVVVTLDDIADLHSSDDFTAVLTARHDELRQKGTYVTI